MGFKRWFEGWEEVGWPDFIRECSRQTVQLKEMTSNQENVCLQRDDREWKNQKISIAGGLACRFSEVQSSSQEQPSWGNYNREKRVFKKIFLMGISGLFPSYRWLKKSWKDFVLFFFFCFPSFFFFRLFFFLLIFHSFSLFPSSLIFPFAAFFFLSFYWPLSMRSVWNLQFCI